MLEGRHDVGREWASTARTGAVADASTERLELVEQLIQLSEPRRIRTFLSRHPHLLTLVLGASVELRRHFGEVGIVVRLHDDPEASGREELFVFAQTLLATSDAFAQLRALDQSWWLEASKQAEGLMNLDIEWA